MQYSIQKPQCKSIKEVIYPASFVAEKEKKIPHTWLYSNLSLISKNRDGGRMEVNIFTSLYFLRSREVQPFSNVFTNVVSHSMTNPSMASKEPLCGHFICRSSPKTESPKLNPTISSRKCVELFIVYSKQQGSLDTDGI